MSTVIRPEISTNNEWWISRERYYELLHFCRQYSEWDLLYRYLQSPESVSIVSLEKYGYGRMNPVEKIFENMEVYRSRMDAVRACCKIADPYLSDFIFKAVTEARSFTYLSTKLDIPCSKKMYYNRYRRFFHQLDRNLIAREKRVL